MPFTYNADSQKQIALAVFGVPYTGLPADRKGLIDNDSTTPGGIAGHVQQMLSNLAQFFYGPYEVPTEWGFWFVNEVSARVAGAIRLEKYQTLRQIANESRDVALQSASQRPMSDASVVSGLNTQTIIAAHIPVLVKQGIYPTRQQVDDAVAEVIDEVWHAGKWPFRAFQAVGTVATNGAVTWTTPSGLAVDKIAISALYIQDQGLQAKVQYIDSEQMAAVEAGAGSSAAPGKPRFFYLQRTVGAPSTLGFKWYPMPDKVYTLIAAVEVQTPGPPSSLTDTSPFARFPIEFKGLIRQGILAAILRMNMYANHQAYLDEYRRNLEYLGSRFASTGQAGNQGRRVADQYQDSFMASYGGGMGGAM
jgi:hypothetical protein